MQQSLLKLNHSLTFDTVAAHYKQLVALYRKNNGKVVLDMSDVKECDSAGLAWLIEARRASHSQGIALFIEKVPEKISALARFYGLEVLLDDK